MSKYTDPSWKETETNIGWSLRNGKEKGRNMMLQALQQANVKFMGQFKDGFHETQDDSHVLALFDACARQDEKEVYNIGRRANGQPDV